MQGERLELHQFHEGFQVAAAQNVFKPAHVAVRLRKALLAKGMRFHHLVSDRGAYCFLSDVHQGYDVAVACKDFLDRVGVGDGPFL